MIRILAPLLIGGIGCAILVALGVWQMQRLEAKEALLAQIEARIGDAPVPLPAEPNTERDAYLPVTVSGVASPGVRVLTSAQFRGAGYRVISVLETDEGRRVLVDRGFLGANEPTEAMAETPVTVTGNLHWPSESDWFTPDPDRDAELWFARDVAKMAEALQTEPVLIIAREIEPDAFSTTPMPVSTGGIANNHLQYVITWFSLAVVWAGMTGLWLWRITRRA